MYDVMVFWETAEHDPDLPPVGQVFARLWKAAHKVVYSRSLKQPRSENTRIERGFDPDAIRRLKAGAAHGISVDGPELAGQALHAGLVDEIHLIQCPIIVGGGKRFFPEGLRLNLELIDQKQFPSGVVFLRYAVR